MEGLQKIFTKKEKNIGKINRTDETNRTDQ